MCKKPLVVVAGVTASGKTALGIALCRAFGGEVVSADSMQVYSGMDNATAAPTPEERAAAPHHLVGFLSPTEQFSVADYAVAARGVIDDIHSRGRLPVVVGGTGLYIKALTDNVLFETFQGDSAVRQSLESLYDEEGGEAMLQRLAEVDPCLAARLHPNNRGRIIRALEVFRCTGVPMSEQQRRAISHGERYSCCQIALAFRSREKLVARINARVDRMLENGLLQQTREFYERYPGKTAASAIGYKELMPALSGEIPLEEGICRLKTATAQYSKRQATWFRRDTRFHTLFADDYTEPCELAQAAAKIVRESEILQSF